MTDPNVQNLILEQLQTLNSRFNLSAERLARVETHVESLVGNTQPGRLTVLENKVSALQQWRWKTTGIYIGVSGVVSTITALVYHLYFK